MADCLNAHESGMVIDVMFMLNYKFLESHCEPCNCGGQFLTARIQIWSNILMSASISLMKLKGWVGVY